MRQPTILVADDDPLLVALLEHKLPSAGFSVVSAPDGQTALNLLKNVRPAAVVLDAMMPGVDGFEVLRRLKADPDRRTLPVVMLTVLRREQDVVGALQLGAADYLVKPFIPDELIVRLRRVVTTARAA